MQKFLTDIHTHSKYSFDGKAELSEMLQVALEKGIAFYGVSEHFDYDAYLFRGDCWVADAETYFHGARHLQEDYEGCMNVLIGAEFGYSDDERVQAFYKETVEKYRPDFAVNSVHALNGNDYYHLSPFYTETSDGKRVLREKKEVYKEYLRLIRKSLDAPYDYDIVGHIGYVTRYAPYEDKALSYRDYAEEVDDILLTIIRKGKIIELNTSRGKGAFLPSQELLRRYYELGGRNVSYGSDAHGVDAVAQGRDEAIAQLKEIGFTHITVPCKGEYIKVEI
ncbi:MAG: histidinol-phosphatase HisJ family protein [Clostridiales bacterium]|nr:histidinol-phosphatase HisJ family protein [Clostridiales bacterium]